MPDNQTGCGMAGGPLDHDVVSPHGSRKTEDKTQGEKHVGTVQEDK